MSDECSELDFKTIEALRVPKNHAFSEDSFEIWRRAAFRCEYCDQYMFETPLIYRSFHYDHILPYFDRRKREPQNHPLFFDSNKLFDKDRRDTSNFALTCILCNTLKGKEDVNRDPEVFLPSMTTLDNSIREELVRRCRRLVAPLRDAWNRDYEKYKNAIEAVRLVVKG